ncbi:hypothetical protein DFH06DRAFT_1465094 [Mycena polygramma]|nr:hypothetical protein DFH06DRAFT_1465094 [Mycena polygramma]
MSLPFSFPSCRLCTSQACASRATWSQVLECAVQRRFLDIPAVTLTRPVVTFPGVSWLGSQFIDRLWAVRHSYSSIVRGCITPTSSRVSLRKLLAQAFTTRRAPEGQPILSPAPRHGDNDHCMLDKTPITKSFMRRARSGPSARHRHVSGCPGSLRPFRVPGFAGCHLIRGTHHRLRLQQSGPQTYISTTPPVMHPTPWTPFGFLLLDTQRSIEHANTPDFTPLGVAFSSRDLAPAYPPIALRRRAARPRYPNAWQTATWWSIACSTRRRVAWLHSVLVVTQQKPQCHRPVQRALMLLPSAMVTTPKLAPFGAAFLSRELASPAACLRPLPPALAAPDGYMAMVPSAFLRGNARRRTDYVADAL